MTPKRLGILVVALVALWSLVGPAETPSPLPVPGIAGVDVAQAGDPDQYTNKPGSSAQAPQDSLPPPPEPPSGLGGHTSTITSSNTLSAVIQAASVLLWGKGSIY